MVEVKHTPGPWTVSDCKKDGLCYSIKIESEQMGRCYVGFAEAPAASPTMIEIAKANANLMATSPELLEALETLVLFTDLKPSNAAALHNAHRVIALAKGGAA